MNKYEVIFIQTETYEVEAKNLLEAKIKAKALLNNDPYAFGDGDPLIEVRRI